MKCPRRLILLAVLPLLPACISAPRATVDLAEIVDQQTREMQVSHERFVSLYYDKLRDDVDNFLAQKWIPQFLSNVISGSSDESARFRAELDKAYKLVTVDWERVVRVVGVDDADVEDAIREALERLATEENAILGEVLLGFARGAQREIDKRRKSLIDPIDEQERFVLEQLRGSYADIQRGHSTIKAYLSSVVDLVEEQDVILEKLGLLDAQKKIVDVAVGASETAASLLQTAEGTDASIDNIISELQKAKTQLEESLGSGG